MRFLFNSVTQKTQVPPTKPLLSARNLCSRASQDAFNCLAKDKLPQVDGISPGAPYRRPPHAPVSCALGVLGITVRSTAFIQLCSCLSWPRLVERGPGQAQRSGSVVSPGEILPNISTGAPAPSGAAALDHVGTEGAGGGSLATLEARCMDRSDARLSSDPFRCIQDCCEQNRLRRKPHWSLRAGTAAQQGAPEKGWGR